jgi:hypothetical protein
VTDRIDPHAGRDFERGLRERLAAIGAQVPVGEPPEPIHHGRGGDPRMLLALAVVVVVVVVVVGIVGAAIALRDSDDGTQVATGDTSSTTASQLVPTPCSDARAGPIFASGTDGEDTWEYTVTGEPPAISQAIRYRGPAGERAGSATYTADSWANLVETGELGTWESRQDPLSPVTFVAGALPAQARAVRFMYPDGRVDEICTVGRLLGLPVVFFVAMLDLDNPPTATTAIDSEGRALASGEVTVRHQPDAATASPLPRMLQVELELNRTLVPLPLQPTS